MKWTEWIPIDAAISGDQQLGAHGVYQIRAVTPRVRPIHIDRILGADPEGILYVGRSGLKLRAPRAQLLTDCANFCGRTILVASPMRRRAPA